MPTQIEGQGGQILQIDGSHRAGRVSLRPVDHGALGQYAVTAVSGTILASLAASSPIFSCRWGNATNLMYIEEISVQAQHSVAAAALAQFDLQLLIARAFTASDTGGTAVTLSGNNAKRRTNMGASLVTNMQVANTGTMTAGTRTLDTSPIGRIQGQMKTTIGGMIFDVLPQPLFKAAPGVHPLIFAQDEGFIISNPIAAPATATWILAVTVRWAEIVSFGNAQLG